MENTDAMMTHFTSGAVIVYLIQYAKEWGWTSWITPDSKTLNRVVSAVAAAVVAFGITATGDLSHGWTIQIPAGSILMTGGWEWVKQYVVQQVVYDGVVDKRVKA